MNDLLKVTLVGTAQGGGVAVVPGSLAEALAAGTRSVALRPALLAVIGERGRWLARWNHDWRWAAEALPELADGVPADTETIWQEGTAAQRLAILRLVRGEDAVRGLE